MKKMSYILWLGVVVLGSSSALAQNQFITRGQFQQSFSPFEKTFYNLRITYLPNNPRVLDLKSTLKKAKNADEVCDFEACHDSITTNLKAAVGKIEIEVLSGDGQSTLGTTQNKDVELEKTIITYMEANAEVSKELSIPDSFQGSPTQLLEIPFKAPNGDELVLSVRPTGQQFEFSVDADQFLYLKSASYILGADWYLYYVGGADGKRSFVSSGNVDFRPISSKSEQNVKREDWE